jgi:hypothetical protein
MPRLTDALSAWETDRFPEALKRELLALGPGALPLHLGTSQGGIVDDSALEATVLDFAAEGSRIAVRVGVFFTEIVGGCSCGDEPMPAHAYCELRIRIDKATGEARIDPVAD